jgi:hypothetical protein
MAAPLLAAGALAAEATALESKLLPDTDDKFNPAAATGEVFHIDDLDENDDDVPQPVSPPPPVESETVLEYLRKFVPPRNGGREAEMLGASITAGGKVVAATADVVVEAARLSSTPLRRVAMPAQLWVVSPGTVGGPYSELC